MSVDTVETNGQSATDQQGAQQGAQQGVQQGAADTTKSYTQDQINALIESRLNRERAKYADYDDLKTKAGELDQLREQSKTEQQKAIDAAVKEAQKAADQKWASLLISAEVRAQAAALHFHDPADAVAQLSSQLGSLKVRDDGAVDADSIKTALADLATKKSYLVDDGKPGRPAGDAGQGARQTTGPADMNELIRGLGRR